MTDQGQERVMCRALIPLAKFFRMPLLEVECGLPIRKNAETGEWEHRVRSFGIVDAGHPAQPPREVRA